MTFGQADTVFVRHERAVIKRRSLQAQRTIKQNLARGGQEQVPPPNHFTDMHRDIVRHNGKLVGGHVVVTPHDKVAEIFSRHEGLRPGAAVFERDHHAVGHTKAPADFVLPPSIAGGTTQLKFRPPATPGRCQSDILPACPWINRFLVALMWSLHRSLHIATGTFAWIDESACAQSFKCMDVVRASLALRVGAARPSAIRPFPPLKAKPPHVFQHGGDELRLAPIAIEIFVAQHESSTAFNGPPLRHPKRPGMTQVKITSRRRRETTPIFESNAGRRRRHKMHLAHEHRIAEMNSVWSMCCRRPAGRITPSPKTLLRPWFERGLAGKMPAAR